MIGYIIISIFVLVILLFVYFEYKNEKKYQKERRQKRPSVRREEKKPLREPTKVPSVKELEEKEEQAKKLEEKKLEEKRFEEKNLKEKRLEEKRLEKKILEEKKLEPEKITVSLADYPKFDHTRLIEMGLSEEEAKEFVAELIPQIEAQMPLIKKAIEISDFHEIELLTHSIKGSSSTVGTGGISDLLADFNTYIKTGKELPIIEAYFEQLNHYYKEIKKQYT